VLDPDAARGAALTDLYQEGVAATEEAAAPAVPEEADEGAVQSDLSRVARVDAAEIEVTLTDLDPDVQQLVADGALEPLDPSGTASEDADANPDAPLCMRMTYRLSYDSDAEVLETVVFYPARSTPAVGDYLRVPAATRRALPVITLNAGVPLQLRAGGNLRRFIDERDPKAAAAAFETLRSAVAEAVGSLSADPAITEAVDAVLVGLG
jgi:hypothetical protein